MKRRYPVGALVVTGLFLNAAAQVRVQELELRLDPLQATIRPYESIVVQVYGYGSVKDASGEEQRVRLRVDNPSFRIREAGGGWLSKNFRFQGTEEEPFYEPEGRGLGAILLGRTSNSFLLQDSVLYTAPERPGSYTVEVSASGRSSSITFNVDLRATRLREPETKTFGVEAREVSSYRRMAEHYAPFVAQATWFDPKSDYLTRFDFDGDWKGDNNWESTPTGSSQAYVYYAVMETGTHWFLIYNFFHPRDYSDKCLAGTCHENDNEGLVLTIRKDGSPYGKLQVMETLAHNNIYSYRNDRQVKKNLHQFDGSVRFQGTSHPAVFIESGGHGVYGVSDRHSRYDFEKGEFTIGTGVTYVYAGAAERPKHPNDRNVGYQLLPIYDHWWLRAHQGGNEATLAFDNFQAYRPYGKRPVPPYSQISGAFRGRRFGENKAKPFWGWHDRRSLKKKKVAAGQWGLDPAYSVSQNLRFPKPFSLEYVHNPFLVLPASAADGRSSRRPGPRERPSANPSASTSGQLPARPVPGSDPAASSGQFDLRLEVDEQTEIVVVGARVLYTVLRGQQPRDAGTTFLQPLPRAPLLEFKVYKREGRGRLRVLETPSASNSFTAKLLLEDPKRGSDRYHLQLRWKWDPSAPAPDRRGAPPPPLAITLPSGEELEPNSDQPADYDYGAAGSLEFSGWVDHEILLRIQADRIFAETVRGKPMESTAFVFSKPLRAGSVHGVRVQKQAGRGQVTLRQVPASSNNFIAIIQIIDPKRGSGFYRFVLHWNDPGG